MSVGFKFIECEQGTERWLAARAGLCTASRFADAISTVGGLTEQQQKFVDAILKNGMSEKAAADHAGYKAVPRATGIAKALRGEDPAEASDIAKRYAADTAIERISGKPFGEPAKTWLLERGHKMEREARMVYEERTKSFVTEAGLCVLDDAPFAYSTDGLVDDDGLIEVKAPIAGDKIIGMWTDGDVSEYEPQCQGGLWITNRKWCDLLMYCPDLGACGKDLFVKRIFRDEEFIDDMVRHLARFQAMVSSYEAVLRAPAGNWLVPSKDDPGVMVPASAKTPDEPIIVPPSRLSAILAGPA